MLFSRAIKVIVLAAAIFGADHLSARDGTTAYSYVDLPASAHIYALGGVNISTIDEDINSVGQNPALLGSEHNMQLGLNYMHYIANSNFGGLRFGKGAGANGSWSAALQYYGYGKMQETDISGAITGEFAPKDISASGTYSHDITDRLRGGIALKALYSSYADFTALALATDLGINYYDPERDLSLSLVAVNLGGQVKRFDQTYERLPADVRLGWTQSFGMLPIRFSATLWNLTRWGTGYSGLMRHIVLGADFMPSDRFYIAAGYNYKTRSDMRADARSLLSGFSVGAGLRTRNFGLGIALAQPHTGTTTFMVSLTASLSEFL